jgi:hypothetical protein
MQLYKISFKSSKKSYIGISSISAEFRLKLHSKQPRYLIGNAFKKYGVDDATLIVLAEHDDWGTLCQMEIDAIIEHNTKAPHGYNLTDGGEGTLGVIYTEEQNRASSERSKAYRAANPEEAAKRQERANITNSTPEARQANSQRQKLRCSTPEARKLLSKYKKDYIDNNPVKFAKQQIKAIAATQTPEFRKAAAERAKLQFSTQEARKSASEKTKNYATKNPEAWAKQIKKSNEAMQTPEARKAAYERATLQFSTPESRQAVSEKSKLISSTPISKARFACRMGAYWAKKQNRPYSPIPREAA